MENWMSFISVIASFTTLISFVVFFVKVGREKGETIAYQKEMRRDIEENARDIDSLGMKVNKMEIENTRLTTTLSNDLSWIKGSLLDIKAEISKKKE